MSDPRASAASLDEKTVFTEDPSDAERPQRFATLSTQVFSDESVSNPGSNPVTVPLDDSNALERLQPGARIHHYELIRKLGQGGMGSVYLARDTKLGRRVAIKFLHTQNPELRQRFILEARTTARCSHENIVTIYEVDAFAGMPFMALEYLQGKTLSELMEKGQRMPVARAVELVAPVVRALACAHEQGIVHRDLKPANILLTDGGVIKVLDFGIAKVLDAEFQALEQLAPHPPEPVPVPAAPPPPQTLSELDSNVDTNELTRVGALMGTLPFMAPEQWRAGTPVDHRVDIWAVGIILFRLLAGTHPLNNLHGEQLFVVGILDEPMPKLADRASDVPEKLCQVVDRCLAKRKEDRYEDAESLLRALEPFLPGSFTRELELSGNQSPYAGLASFQKEDANRFFGRAREVAALVSRLGDQPLIGVIGTSGTGKSSLIRAGVLPSLERLGNAWEAAVIRPGRQPVSALADLVAPWVDDLPSGEEGMGVLQERILREPGWVGALFRDRARKENRKQLLFVDQFEELYTLVPDSAARLAFTAALSSIADDPSSPTRVVLSIRSDFLDRVAEDADFMGELSAGLFFLNTPGRDGLRDALVQPARMAGYAFETPEMVEQMIDHLETTPGALPLLQFSATQLWERRDPNRRLLTQASYEEIGGIAGALASHADSVLTGLTEVRRKLARALFLRLVTPDRTRAIVSMEELFELSSATDEVKRLVDLLVQARLLVVQTGGDGVTVEIVHESLITSWPTLERWLDEGQEDAVFLDQLRNAARQWNAKKRDSGLLWRGEAVEEARRFRRRYRGELPEMQREFLEEVLAQQAKSARRKQILVAGGGLFFFVLFIASVVALVVIYQARQDAQSQAAAAKKAEKVAMTAEAQAQRNLQEVKAKEIQREAAERQAEEASLALQKKNGELISALERAQQARASAKRSQHRAEKSADVAKEARMASLQAAKELQALLDKEKDRVEHLQKQLGSPVIETLK